MSPLFFLVPGLEYTALHVFKCFFFIFQTPHLDSAEKFVLMKTKFRQRQFDLICVLVISDTKFQIFNTVVLDCATKQFKTIREPSMFCFVLFFLNQAAVDTAHCYGPCQMKQHIWTGRAMAIKCPPMPVCSLMGPAEAATGSDNMSRQKWKLLALFQTENKS